LWGDDGWGGWSDAELISYELMSGMSEVRGDDLDCDDLDFDFEEDSEVG
jgi:hypothetical protein